MKKNTHSYVKGGLYRLTSEYGRDLFSCFYHVDSIKTAKIFNRWILENEYTLDNRLHGLLADRIKAPSVAMYNCYVKHCIKGQTRRIHFWIHKDEWWVTFDGESNDEARMEQIA